MKIVHAADIHLGRRRLDGRLPESDFAAAFHYIAEVAIAEKADAFLLAGDLFDKPQVEPPHLRQAEAVLVKLRTAGIPVLAISGNHDKPFLSSGVETWLEYLAGHQLVRFLETRFGPGGPSLVPWTADSSQGAWLDLHGVRFVGAGYLGAATPHKVRQIVDKLEPGRTHVLLLHAGPDYFVGEGGGFSSDDLNAIRERIAYLALGHIHKPMIHDGWACNPGSPENCDLQESLYDRNKAGSPQPRGYAVIEIDPSSKRPLQKLEIRSNPRRPVLHLKLDCKPFGNKLKDGVATLEKAACAEITSAGAPLNAAVLLRLTGALNLARLALDLQTAALHIQQAAGVAAVTLDASDINLESLAAAEQPGAAGSSREEIERASIRTLVDEQHLWNLESEEEQIAAFFYELKESVRKGVPEEQIAEQIQLHPLIEKILTVRRNDSPPPETQAPENGLLALA